jgi:hypothetical protein
MESAAADWRRKVPAYQSARNDFFAYQLHNFSVPHPAPYAPKNLYVRILICCWQFCLGFVVSK